MDTLLISQNILIVKKNKFTQFFILGNFREFIKVLKNLMSVLNLIPLDLLKYLNFALLTILNLFIQQLQHLLAKRNLIKTYLHMLLQNQRI